MGVGNGRKRFIVAAFGDAGHAFPAIALALALRDRGHEVLVESWEQWEEAIAAAGLRFEAAQQYEVFPPPGPDTPQGLIVARAAEALSGLMEDFAPDLVVCDILTRAPQLAAEVAGIPQATLIPHVYPVMERIMDGYQNGTKFGIHMDTDGLICAGEGLAQVTWITNFNFKKKSED